MDRALILVIVLRLTLIFVPSLREITCLILLLALLTGVIRLVSRRRDAWHASLRRVVHMVIFALISLILLLKLLIETKLCLLILLRIKWGQNLLRRSITASASICRVKRLVCYSLRGFQLPIRVQWLLTATAIATVSLLAWCDPPILVKPVWLLRGLLFCVRAFWNKCIANKFVKLRRRIVDRVVHHLLTSSSKRRRVDVSWFELTATAAIATCRVIWHILNNPLPLMISMITLFLFENTWFWLCLLHSFLITHYKLI